MKAVGHNDKESVIHLLEYGADVNLRDLHKRTALHDAAMPRLGNVEIMHLLLEKNPDLTIKDYEGKTARDRAVQANHYEMVRMIDKFTNNE